MTEFILGLDELDKLVAELPDEGIVLLRGDLASGKTTLVKQICKFKNIADEVTSPTFSVMHSYDDRVFHYDIYQKGVDAILVNGLFENLFKDGLHLVEWADDALINLLQNYGLKYTILDILPESEKRKYRVQNG